MPAGPQNRPPSLTVVSSPPEDPTRSSIPDTDWSILMARSQAGDREAYRRLLLAITPFLRTLARRSHLDGADAEDAVQDVLMTMHAIRHIYDPGRPFGPWLVAIAQRRIVDHLRRRGRLRKRETELKPEHETFSAYEPNLGSDRQAIERAVEGLPPAQREAIRLLKLNELSLKEASQKSGMSVAALKVATHRGLRTLRKLALSVN
jgi:RNA polymerase sigma factor (sigma-70 family)